VSLNLRAKYLLNPKARIRGQRRFELDAETVLRAIHRSHEIIAKFSSFEVDVFQILGMRNLSAFVGEIFAAALAKERPDTLRKNPHQDGYPDLLIIDEVGSAEWARLASRLRDKAPFSPFATGGFEVKATCGSVPTPDVCRRRGFEKPDIGDSRLPVLSGYDWKAHHRETNHLFGIVWDFIDRVPAIVAVFYSSDLTTNDWGRIVQPTEGGGRTTSVSIMSKDGIKKMYNGWVLVATQPDYLSYFDQKNNGSLMKQAALQHKA
jgi:hypothetical protein